MNIGEHTYHSNKPYRESDLIPAISIQTQEDQEKFFEQYGQRVHLYDSIKQLAIKHGLTPENIYITPNKYVDLYCYYEFPVFIPLMTLDEQFLIMMRMSERVIATKERSLSALKEMNIFKILAHSEDSAKIMLFNKLYWHVSAQDRYKAWVEVYQFLDYGHIEINKKITEDAISNQPTQYRNEIRKKLDKCFEDDFISIYRGVGKVSVEASTSMSWTTSLSIASFFASRYEIGGKVFQAKIHKDHIIDFLRNRGEEEVIVLPEHLKEVKEYPMIPLIQEYEELIKEGYVDEYCTYRNTYIESSDYLHPEGIHGIPHIKRVLFHCLAMAKHLRLSSSERAILANSALYHDIGRKHDGYCLEHGFWSWKKLNDKIKREPTNYLSEVNYVDNYKKGIEDYELRALDKEESKIVQFLIEYHCISDAKSWKELKKRSFKNEEQTWKLYQIFKDCDGLDRIRLSKSDLDTSYLRTDIAKKRVLVAHELPKIKQL